MSDIKNYTYKTQGYALQSPGPATVEAYDAVAGSPGSCLVDAVESEIFRGTIPAFWKKAIPEIEKLTGVTRGIDEKATAKAKERAKEGASVKDVPEKFSSFMTRVEASLGEDKEAHAALEELLKQIALTVTIDPSPTNRASGPGKDFLDAADTVLALPSDKLEEKVAKFINIVGEFDLERDEAGQPTRTSLGHLIKAVFAASL